MNYILSSIRSELNNKLRKKGINYTVTPAYEDSVIVTIKINLRTAAVEKTYLIQQDNGGYTVQYDDLKIVTITPIMAIYNDIRKIEIKFSNI